MPGEEAQQQQRRVVGAVHVVEDQHERPLLRRGAQQRRHGIEELKARGVGVLDVGRARGASRDGPDGRQPRHQLRQPSGDLRPERLQRRFDVALGDQAAHDLRPRPVGRRAAALPGAAPQHAGAAGGRLVADRVGERGLAHAGIAGDDEQRAVAGERALEPAPQLGELAVPSDQRALSVGHDQSLCTA